MPAGYALPLADNVEDLLPDLLQRDAERAERLGGEAIALADEPEQDVLGADVAVAQESRFLLGVDDRRPGPVGKPLEHGSMVPTWSQPCQYHVSDTVLCDESDPRGE